MKPLLLANGALGWTPMPEQLGKSQNTRPLDMTVNFIQQTLVRHTRKKKKRKTTAGQLQLLRHQTFSQANTTETFSRNLTPATRPPRSHTRTRSVTLPATHSPHVLAWLPPLLHTSVHSPLKPSLLSHTHSHTNTVSVTKVYASCSSEAAAVPGCQRHKREKHCTAFHVVRLRNVMDLASDSLGMT